MKNLFSMSFRPFFLLASLLAFLNPSFWVSYYTGHIDLPIYNVTALFWHGHEMTFAFTSALIAGFILTASSHWSQTTPYHGWPLFFLTLIWSLERIIYFFPLPKSLIFILSTPFLIFLTAMLYTKNRHHHEIRKVFFPLLILFFTFKTLHLYGHLYNHPIIEEIGKYSGLNFIRFLLFLILNKILPFFIKSRVPDFSPEISPLIKKISLMSLFLLIIPWQTSISSLWIVPLYLMAIISMFICFIKWRIDKCFKIPILSILHLGVFILIISLLFEVMAIFNEQFRFSQATLHLFTTGALGIISIGIMGRVSLGHTGRKIQADFLLLLSYFCILLGSGLRIIIPIFFENLYLASLHYASGIWTLGFLIFFLRFFKILII